MSRRMEIHESPRGELGWVVLTIKEAKSLVAIAQSLLRPLVQAPSVRAFLQLQYVR